MTLTTAWKKALMAAALASASGACMTNPTPHPERDATENATSADTTTPSAQGPDEDGDGVPDCVELNGTWDGSSCLTGGGQFDGSDSGDTAASEGDTIGDGDDGDDGDAADWQDDAADSASSPADR